MLPANKAKPVKPQTVMWLNDSLTKQKQSDHGYKLLLFMQQSS